MLTEEKAKKKWCPFARMRWDNIPLNRDGYDKPITRCIASECMAWRWDFSLWNLEAKRWWQSGDSTNSAVEHRVTDRGRCGLAGD